VVLSIIGRNLWFIDEKQAYGLLEH